MTIALTPRKAINKAYLKVKPTRSEIELFIENLLKLLTHINDAETEEFHKNIISDFLKKTYYDQTHFINTKGRNDLVIHNGNTAQDTVGVIIEAKRTTNSSEMLRQENLNTKAMQELVLYYLRERITNKNLEVKHLIATNINEWFIFDASVFEKAFAQNKKLVHDFVAFEEGRLSGTKTDFFYANIAAPAIGAIQGALEYAYVDLRTFSNLLNKSNTEFGKLIPLYKLFSPQHLLKTKFINDSNNLNNAFYSELLHIIGLTEKKDGSKKLIVRNEEASRHTGSLIENAIIQIESLDKISRIPNCKQYGETKEKQLFNVALELVITWVNRILFLKLLEAQLVTYNKDDTSYRFLSIENVGDFDELNALFFQVLAVKQQERNSGVKAKYGKVPYLNSSLFDVTDIEHQAILISNLSDEKKLPLLSSTVLKGRLGKKVTGELNAIEYLFKFLDAYDFTSEGGDEVKESSKALINASVLGLIFEKINGYKDGSFFTPGFITMYMCRETIRRAVIQKFNECKGWTCNSIEELYNEIKDTQEANAIVNSITICDPAVGSGHFLVSSLNELIAVKAELRILQDKSGKWLKEYNVDVVNDELIVTDEDGEFLTYNTNSKESQRIQETLFNEKKTIIENCLFGVDINPNSVKICRLRLWIELLKNAYYKENGELETLPNIDINIKSGNSLISRFQLNADLKSALKISNLNITKYKAAVQSYKNATSKEQKHEMEELIAAIKNNFRTEIYSNDKKVVSLANFKDELRTLLNQAHLFEVDKKQEKRIKDKQKKIEGNIGKLEAEIEEIRSNRIYVNAFEWRFEFPEVLNDEGTFIGFDAVIGNPPYGVAIRDKNERAKLTASLGKVPDYEIYYMFINLARLLLKDNHNLSLIIPNTFLFNVFAQSYRLWLLDNFEIDEILDCTQFKLFDDAAVSNAILMCGKRKGSLVGYKPTGDKNSFAELAEQNRSFLGINEVANNNINWSLLFKLNKETISLVRKIKSNSVALSKLFPDTSQGLIAYDKLRGQANSFIKERKLHAMRKIDSTYKCWLYGEDINRYKIKWNEKEFISYCDKVANPRQPKFFIGERILVREITNPRVFAAITDEEFYFDPAVIAIMNPANSTLSLFALLAILNSKLANFYHFNASPKATKGAFPKILICDINNFPLPANLPLNTCNELDKLARKMHKNFDANTDNEIDKLVYRLYLLADDEINVIEQFIH